MLTHGAKSIEALGKTKFQHYWEVNIEDEIEKVNARYEAWLVEQTKKDGVLNGLGFRKTGCASC